MWQWLVAGLLGIITLGSTYADSSGRFSLVIALVLLATTMAVRVLVERQVPGGRTGASMRRHLLLTALIAGVLVFLAIKHTAAMSADMWPVVLYSAVLALAVTFVVGGKPRTPGHHTWARYIGYGVAALVSGAVVSNLFDHPGEFVFPLGALVVVVYGGPGAALGGLLGWMVRAASDWITA